MSEKCPGCGAAEVGRSDEGSCIWFDCYSRTVGGKYKPGIQCLEAQLAQATAENERLKGKLAKEARHIRLVEHNASHRCSVMRSGRRKMGDQLVALGHRCRALEAIFDKLPLDLRDPDRPLLMTKRQGWVDLHDYALIQRDHYDRLVAAEAAGKE